MDDPWDCPRALLWDKFYLLLLVPSVQHKIIQKLWVTFRGLRKKHFFFQKLEGKTKQPKRYSHRNYFVCVFSIYQRCQFPNSWETKSLKWLHDYVWWKVGTNLWGAAFDTKLERPFTMGPTLICWNLFLLEEIEWLRAIRKVKSPLKERQNRGWLVPSLERTFH